MLTIKNWVRSKSALFLAATVLLTSCAPPGPRALLQGQRLLEQGKYAEAVEKLKTATVLLATNAPASDAAQAWNYLGVACHHAGQPAAAEQAYLRAEALDHDLAEAHYNLGCLLLEENRFDGARGEFTTYTLRRSTEPEGFVKLGFAKLWGSGTGAARDRTRLLTEAENSFKEALKLSPQDPEALNGLGLTRLYHSQPGEAAQYFSSALKLQPAYGPALLNLAIVAQQYLNQPQVAMEKYRAYLALKPAPANAEAVRQALRQLEQAAGPAARPAGTPASATPPATPNAPKAPGANPPKAPAPGTAKPAAAAAASPTQTAEEPKLAEESAAKPAPEVQTASAANPPAAVPVSTAGVTETNAPRRSFLQRLFGRSEPAAAQPTPVAAAVAPAAVDGPTNSLVTEADLPALPAPPGSHYSYKTPCKPAAGNRAEAQRAFASALQAQGVRQWAEAIKHYHAAIQADPSFFEAYYNLSLAAAEAGELRTALAASDNAVSIQPESVKARYNFALALKRANYWVDAANELEKLLAYAPNNADAHLALANLYGQQLRQPAKARPHYQRALELAPHMKQAESIRNWLARNR